MNVIDLTHTITEDMPMFPETEQPSIKGYATVDVDGFRECMITLDSHTGTHMDSPAHAISGGKTLDLLPSDQFMGRALVIDCRDVPRGGTIGLDRLERYGDAANEVDFLVLDLGWAGRWGTDEYFGDYPCMSDELIDRIVAGSWKGVCLDCPSVDPVDDVNMTRHRRLLGGRDVVIVENLCNLEGLGDGPFWLGCFPLRYANADGSPIRALAWLDE